MADVQKESNDDKVLEVIAIFGGIAVGLALFILLAPILILAAIIFGLTVATKKVKWLTYGAYGAGALFVLVMFLTSWRELFQTIPIVLTLIGMESPIAKLEDLINNGEAFQPTAATYILTLAASVVVARIMLAVYQFFKGKIVKPKEDEIKEFRESKEFVNILRNKNKINEKEQRQFRKQKEKELAKGEPSGDILLGINEHGKPVHMQLKELTQHTLLQGTTGSGKTIAAYSPVETSLIKGESVVFIDGKGDVKTIKQLQALCDQYGRKLHVFSEDTKLRYNPIRNGNRTSVTDRIMAIFDWSNEFYKNEAENHLQKVIHFLDDYEIDRDLPNATHFLSMPRIYEKLRSDYVTRTIMKKEKRKVERVPAEEPAAETDDLLGIMTEHSQSSETEGEYEEVEVPQEITEPSERSKKYMQYFFGKDSLSEEEELKLLNGTDETSKLFKGMQSQLEKLIYSELGHLLRDKGDDVDDSNVIDLSEIIAKGESVIFSFNSLSYAEFIKRFARFVVADIANAVQVLFGRTDGKGVTGVFDEFGAYGSETIIDIVARARSANFRAIIGVQSLGDLIIDKKDISQTVIDNCNTFIFGRSNSSESAERVAGIMGTYADKDITHQLENKGTIFKRMEFKSEKGTARNVNRFYVHPDQIKELGQGEFAVLRKAANGLTPEERRQIIYFRNPLEGLKEKG